MSVETDIAEIKTDVKHILKSVDAHDNETKGIKTTVDRIVGAGILMGALMGSGVFAAVFKMMG